MNGVVLWFGLRFWYLAIQKYFEHHDHSPVTYVDFLKLSLVLIIWIKIWITKTIAINKYGQNKIFEKLFILFDIGLIMYMSNSINAEWEITFKSFNIALSVIYFSFSFQNIYYWTRNKNLNQHKLTFVINSFYFLNIGILVMIFAFLPHHIGIYLIIITIGLSWILPLFWRPWVKNNNQGINLPHLIERLNLITIIFFGEMLIVLSYYFKDLDWKGVLGMFFVGSLLIYYIHYFEKLIDQHSNVKRWYIMVLVHVIIYLSLTLDYEFNLHHTISNWPIWIICFAVLFIYVVMMNILIITFPKQSAQKRKISIGVVPIIIFILVCTLGTIYDKHLNEQTRFIIVMLSFVLVHIDLNVYTFVTKIRKKANPFGLAFFHFSLWYSFF
ncbi:low temperature requirement protein A [Mycoplasmopsis pullorum]|uniref:low temperature requirement protein A n=1 Tax=Mycoplasmopsis pullorum TaxID=48003 RepID=UPI001C6591C0|nr:low temperature requirement protein A [Mycoplasmopsis pullorum]